LVGGFEATKTGGHNSFKSIVESHFGYHSIFSKILVSDKGSFFSEIDSAHNNSHNYYPELKIRFSWPK
jgi:hypothetical protein